MPSRNGNISFPVHRLYCRFPFLFPFLRVEIGGKYSTAAASQRVDSRAQQNSRENIRSVKEVGTLGSSLEYGEGKKECRIKTLYIPMKNRSGLSGRQDGDCFMGTRYPQDPAVPQTSARDFECVYVKGRRRFQLSSARGTFTIHGSPLLRYEKRLRLVLKKAGRHGKTT